MKKTVQFAISFLLILAISISALLYLFYDAAQLHYKIEAQENIKVSGRLETVKLPVKEFKNRKDADELWVNGKLYDVSSYVIVNDTVFVSVFHDADEEGVVKSIVDSFEPNDKYASDNIVHVCRHRIHAPDNSKILMPPFTIKFISTASVNEPAPCFTGYSPNVPIGVIKPPPKQVSA